MVDISNNNINSKMNILDKTTLYFLSNKTYLNKLNNNIINNNNDENDLKTDFIMYKKPIKNIINKLFEQYTTVDSDINNQKLNINERNNKYEHAFYIFSKLCIEHIKSENINKQINSDLSNYSNFNNINLNIDNIDNSNNSVYIDISYDTKNDDKILFINNTNNSNNIKNFVDIKKKNFKKKILPRRIE